MGANHFKISSSHLAKLQEIGLSKYTLMRESQFHFIYLLFMPSTFRELLRYTEPRHIELGRKNKHLRWGVHSYLAGREVPSCWCTPVRARGDQVPGESSETWK